MLPAKVLTVGITLVDVHQSWEISIQYFNRLHEFSVTILICYKNKIKLSLTIVTESVITGKLRHHDRLTNKEVLYICIFAFFAKWKKGF